MAHFGEYPGGFPAPIYDLNPVAGTEGVPGLPWTKQELDRIRVDAEKAGVALPEADSELERYLDNIGVESAYNA